MCLEYEMLLVVHILYVFKNKYCIHGHIILIDLTCDFQLKSFHIIPYDSYCAPCIR